MTDEVKVEAEVKEVETPEVVLSPIEQEVVDQGWKPKEDFIKDGGDPEEWKTARQWKKDGELRAKLESVTSTLNQTNSTLKALKSHYEKVKETEYKHALDTLKRQKKVALDEGDSDAVVDIDEQIAATKEAQKEATKVVVEAPQVHPDFTRWVSDNNWYQSDRELRVFADTLGNNYAVQNPHITPQEVLTYVSKSVKRAFPDKFKNVRREQPSSVEASRPASKSTNASYELSPQEQKAMETLISSGHMTKEQYIADLKKIKGEK